MIIFFFFLQLLSVFVDTEGEGENSSMDIEWDGKEEEDTYFRHKDFQLEINSDLT